MRHDEFNSEPLEYSKLPSEDNKHLKEFNEDYAFKKLNEKTDEKRVQEEKKRKNLKRRLISYLTGAAVGVSMIGAADARANKIDVIKAPQYEFACYHEAFSEISEDKTIVVLTDNEKAHSVGAVWSEIPVKVDDSITLEFDFLLSGDIDDTSNMDLTGDGMSVSFVNADKIAFDKQKTGGELGYIGNFGVEVDLFSNPYGEIRGIGDMNGNHIAILDKAMNHLAGTENVIARGHNWYHMTIVYTIIDETSAEIKAYVGDMLCGEATINGLPMYQGYIGISAANGDATGWAVISDLKINEKTVLIKSNDKTDIINRLSSSHNIPPSMGGKESDVIIDDSEDNVIEEENRNEHKENDESKIPETPTSSDSDTDEESSKETVKCSECNGYGIICTGSAAADDPDGCGGKVIVHCKACNNTGKEPNGKPCNWCKGTLEHLCPSFETHRECEKCGGTGYIIE